MLGYGSGCALPACCLRQDVLSCMRQPVHASSHCVELGRRANQLMDTAWVRTPAIYQNSTCMERSITAATGSRHHSVVWAHAFFTSRDTRLMLHDRAFLIRYERLQCGLWAIIYRVRSDDNRRTTAELHAYAQVSVLVLTEGCCPDRISLLADLRAKTCTRTVGRIRNTIVLELFVTNVNNEYTLCENMRT